MIGLIVIGACLLLVIFFVFLQSIAYTRFKTFSDTHGQEHR